MIHNASDTVAAVVLVLLSGLGSSAPAQAQSNGVSFVAEFPTQLLGAGALTRGADTSIHVGLRVTNHTGSALRFSFYRAILPELLDGTGAVVPFEFGANRSPMPR